MRREKYDIDYFGVRTVQRYGTLLDAMAYVDSFAKLAEEPYVGDVTIRDEYGRVVAKRTWTSTGDGSSVPSQWRVGRKAVL